MVIRILRSTLVLAVVLAIGLFTVSNVSADVIGILSVGSSGNVTSTLSGLNFNPDSAALPAAGPPWNSDVSNGTALTFAGCVSGVLGSPGCLFVQEGITVKNSDLTIASVYPDNTFLTFESHPNLVFSINGVLPGSANTNCATANANGLSCSVFAGSPIILTYQNGGTVASIAVFGKASDAGVGGLPTANNYSGNFSDSFAGMSPLQVQQFFCPTLTCTPADFASGRSLQLPVSGNFSAAAVPEIDSLSLLGIGMVGLGLYSRRKNRTKL